MYFKHHRSISLPCAPSYQGFPVVAPAVDVHIPCDAVAALAGEAVLSVALLGQRLISLHCQVVMGDLQLLVGGLGVQLEWLAWTKRTERDNMVKLARGYDRIGYEGSSCMYGVHIRTPSPTCDAVLIWTPY